MEYAVQVLASLLPELRALGESVSRSRPGMMCRVFSHRHAESLHSLGLSCFPVGSDELDERCVALIVNVIGLNGLTIKASVQWQAPSFHHEAETAVCRNPSADDLASFFPSVRGLFDRLQVAAERGGPPAVAHRKADQSGEPDRRTTPFFES